jgi:bifunctional DNase/RNase
VREVDVIGVRVEMPSNQPIVLLREASGERYLPIWIGAVEATAIAFAQQGVVPPRPLTHDLMKDVLEATGQSLSEVRVTDVKDGVFYAELVFASGQVVSARPSDSIALALRSTRPASPCRPSRRTRWRPSASSSTTSHPRTSRSRDPHPQPQVEGCDTPPGRLTTLHHRHRLKFSAVTPPVWLLFPASAFPRSYAQRRRDRGGSPWL